MQYNCAQRLSNDTKVTALLLSLLFLSTCNGNGVTFVRIVTVTVFERRKDEAIPLLLSLNEKTKGHFLWKLLETKPCFRLHFSLLKMRIEKMSDILSLALPHISNLLSKKVTVSVTVL